MAWTGISVGIAQFSQAHTASQIAQTVAEFAFGVFALLSVVTTFWGRRWNRLMLVCWVACLTLAGALLYVAWSHLSVASGVLAGGIVLLVALAIVWLHRVGNRATKEG